ncbi:MAG: methyltransferase, partial [Caulobacteraceae bacterium]|nr:methyltransferase [Caulobacteraceae bacterium]
GLRPRLRQCDGMPAGDGPASLILANPPYLGGSGRTYSDGGGPLGAQLSLAWTRQALARLAPGGRLLLYTGAAILRGRDPLQAALRQIAGEAGCPLRYEELDPDVFPSTLLHRGYWGVERIAAVGAVMDKPADARNLAQA